MSKFQVGDRWADQKGREWFVYGKTAAGAKALAFCQEVGIASGFDFDEGYGDACVRGDVPCLTRLISSERWIPFTEMVPEGPRDSSRLLVVANSATDHCVYRGHRWFDGGWEWIDALGCGLEGFYPNSKWRYISPPETT